MVKRMNVSLSDHPAFRKQWTSPDNTP